MLQPLLSMPFFLRLGPMDSILLGDITTCAGDPVLILLSRVAGEPSWSGISITDIKSGGLCNSKSSLEVVLFSIAICGNRPRFVWEDRGCKTHCNWFSSTLGSYATSSNSSGTRVCLLANAKAPGWDINVVVEVSVEGSHPKESFTVQLPCSVKTRAEEHDGIPIGHSNDFCAFYFLIILGSWDPVPYLHLCCQRLFQVVSLFV